MAVLTFQRCVACAAVVFPRRAMCPRCGATALDTVVSGGRGVVYSTTAVHRRDGVHNVALVDVEEGFRLMTEVVGIDPEAVAIGMAVFAQDDGERVVFSPVEPADG
jgi:uncharacterized OB-fold protein